MNTKEVCNETSVKGAFWKAVNILIKKPHVVNKRLWGCKIIFTISCRTISSEWSLPQNCETKYKLNIEEYRRNILQELNVEQVVDENVVSNIEIVLEELFPKAYKEKHAFQLIILMKQDHEVRFFDVTSDVEENNLCPHFSYSLQLINNNVVLKSDCTKSKSYKWLEDMVLPQFIKWSEEKGKQEQKVYTESLTLVSSEKYYQKYNELKEKHGKDMVKIWPECTDPAKFVYEDIAIATYLLLLWADEKHHLNLTTPQTFVDLGCGNGLLVYILVKEGHVGVGIDVRKRQIWDMYTSDIKLEEKTIIPSDSHLFPDTDWIIGNHSDELTPWIPVIAARSSYKCNFFLLPCCAFNFDGSKYRRQNSSISQYTEYLQYIKDLCGKCGFETDVDRLKIPSTKRICLVGRGRTYLEEEHDHYCNRMYNIINNLNTTIPKKDEIASWVKDFKPRESIEKIRNCTQIDKTLIASIVERISDYLLDECCLDSNWSIGKVVDLNEVVKLIPFDDLKALKSECGGLQTLLRNNHQIFRVQGGKVQLRYPKSIEEVNNSVNLSKKKTSKLKIQQKPCWFYNKHPQGCPLKDSECSFLHIVM